MRRKVIVVFVCILLITVLTPILYYYYVYVPNVFGSEYLSVSFTPEFHSHNEYLLGNMYVRWENITARTGWASIQIVATNRYFAPIKLKYSGFDVVWLIYNRTVSDPSDIVTYRDFLVWGAYSYLTFISYHQPGAYTFMGEGFQYYVDRRELSNYTITMDAGTHFTGNFFDTPSYHWYGQYWFDIHSRAPPGTYFMYAIILGIAGGPQNATIVSYVT